MECNEIRASVPRNPGFRKLHPGYSLKWQITEVPAGTPVTNLASVNLKVQDVNCILGSTTDLLEEVASGGSGLKNLGGGSYQFNWKTPQSYANSCKKLTLDLGGGLFAPPALFSFK